MCNQHSETARRRNSLQRELLKLADDFERKRAVMRLEHDRAVSGVDSLVGKIRRAFMAARDDGDFTIDELTALQDIQSEALNNIE